MSELWPKAEARDMKSTATQSVLIAARVHPFPFRTRKLSSPVPKILVWRRTGKIGQCQHKKPQSFDCGFLRFCLNPIARRDGNAE